MAKRPARSVPGQNQGKTVAMQLYELRAGRPLEEMLLEAHRQYGSIRAAATALGLDYSTMARWMRRLGFRIHLVAEYCANCGTMLSPDADVWDAEPDGAPTPAGGP